MAKKKKSKSVPKRKRMTRESRLRSSKTKQWIASYRGNNIVKGYAKWHGVDLLCAVIELRKLGIPVSDEREQEIRTTIHAREKQNAARKLKQATSKADWSEESEWGFAYIAGYTSGGAPYGLTHEENAVLNGEAEPEPWFGNADDVPF